ncbi:hypothetical protein CKF94_17905 [Vibrio coralliilyticus]|uniref:DNA/RNA helicase domain-containing protein n=1 Tax=Vibrio coralliilyticus TaxID=190893 RepID=UPI000BAAF50E|nr:DNA/RNA helicase domain-containing protein [Vibrio coralliilyticus]PAU36851.1 hypothetical protein CKF94_17905 [Vibrio coralliilyticus]
MKNINILSLIQAYDSLSSIDYDLFVKYYGIDIKPKEVDDLKLLIGETYKMHPFTNLFDKFYVGYKIKHISKEFDLLRFGDNCIINIELKSDSTEDKILKQLTRNRYYLSHINNVVYNFTFVSKTNTLYMLNSSNSLEKVDFNFLVQVVTYQNLMHVENPDELFNPSDYLVSPFNSTDKFVGNQYFLTNQQEDIKNQILSKFNNNSACFISITGGAGTGKTLLTYDIAKCIKDMKRTKIVHCGQLNSGHVRLNSMNWGIIPIKEIGSCKLSNFDVIIIDEAQRIRSSQLDILISEAMENSIKCIFSYDKNQILANWESVDIENKLKSTNLSSSFKLSEKIRTNKEIADFIRMFFDKNKNIPTQYNGNVDFEYFTDLQDVNNYIDLINNSGWEVLKLTSSRYNGEYHTSYSKYYSKNSHEVIGQEFDNVAVVIDQFFSYDDNGKLIYNSKTYYNSVKMLFQNITRTRKKLKLIIINNQQVLSRCLSILK